jgi:hypothetical protein
MIKSRKLRRFFRAAICIALAVVFCIFALPQIYAVLTNFSGKRAVVRKFKEDYGIDIRSYADILYYDLNVTLDGSDYYGLFDLTIDGIEFFDIISDATHYTWHYSETEPEAAQTRLTTSYVYRWNDDKFKTRLQGNFFWIEQEEYEYEVGYYFGYTMIFLETNFVCYKNDAGI